MENENDKNKEYDVYEEAIDKDRLQIINDIFQNFTLLFSEKKYEDIPSNFQKDKKICIDEIKKIYKELRIGEINYILFSFTFAKDKSVNNIINFIDTINTILSHWEYYKKKNPKIKFNNSHFDNYLLKRYECAYIFTEFFSNKGCRELKIDNKLYFNYIPIKCLIKKHTKAIEKNKADQKEIEECPFAHNRVEEMNHPFVYKKFKCFRKNCKEDNCFLYHEKEENMETEVDFDSNEIINLQTVLSSLRLNKDDIKNNEKLELYLQKKSKDTGDFIPSEFNPLTYKIYKCPLGPICKLDKKLCLNYHGESDRRRNPKFHKASLCPNLYEKNKRIKGAKCENGDDCEYSHNLYEYYYHPDKFRTIKCPQEKKEGEYCKERLICPYLHKTDSDCGKDGIKMILDEKLITDYYRSLIVGYEKSIDDENSKLKEIEKKYVCYKCGERHTNILNNNNETFFVDKKENKIVCLDCARKYYIDYEEIGW